VLKGDLVTTPLPEVLRQLADGTSSGCLHVLDARGEEGRVYLRGGMVYAVQVPGQRPLLGQFLVSSGALGPEMLAEALEAQRTELQGWKLGELLVHLGYVDEPVVEAFLAEQVRDQAGDLLRWPTGTWKFRVNERTREDVARPTSVQELLADLDQRAAEWDAITQAVHGPEAVPVLSAAGTTDTEMAIDAEAWSLLCKVDGARTIEELAVECGFTLFEAGRVVHSLVRNGLLEVEEPLVEVEEDAAVPAGSITSRLAAAFAPAEAAPVVIPHQAEEPSPSDVAQLLSAALGDSRAHALASPTETEIDGSIDRISAALSQMLGTSTADEELFAPKPRRHKEQQSAKQLTPAEQEKAEREARRRARDAEELQQAQAELEAARRAAETDPHNGPDAEIVSLAEVRREAARREEEEAARVAEGARLAEEARQRREEEARRAEAEQALLAEEARRAEAEAAGVAEEARLADEARALEAEKARLAEERAALEEKARKAEEDKARREQERARKAEEKRLAEEEKARQAEEKRLADEAKALEAEKARLAEERARLEEEARLAEVEAARLEEEERLAAEAEQARLAQEEADRLAAEEAGRLAAEEAARAAAEEEARLAFEAEQARAAEEARLVEEARLAEDHRLAEEARIAEEQRLAEEIRLAEEQRLAYEQEQARLQAELEERLRAEEEARAAAEAFAAEQARFDQEEQERREVQAAADAALDAQAQAAAQRSAASDAFAELSAVAQLDVPLVQPDPVVEPQADAEPEELYAPPAAPAADISLMFRELSEFNRDEEPATPTAPPAPVRTAVKPAAPEPKRKGLFKR
jgi:hypothetical protein